MNQDWNVLLWLLIFFLVFYIYIDIRISNLRRELLDHYRVCESFIFDKQRSSVETFASSYPDKDPDSLVESFIPTKEEVAIGFNSLNDLQKDMSGSDWIFNATNAAIKDGIMKNVVEYNAPGVGDFASFGN